MSDSGYSAFVEIRRIRSLRQDLTVQAIKTFVCAFVLSKLDNCYFLCLAAHFTFSVDYRKFRTLRRNWYSKHANFRMCNLFFKLFIGYRSKQE